MKTSSAYICQVRSKYCIVLQCHGPMKVLSLKFSNCSRQSSLMSANVFSFSHYCSSDAVTSITLCLESTINNCKTFLQHFQMPVWLMLLQCHLNNFPTLLFVLVFHNSQKYQSSGEQNSKQMQRRSEKGNWFSWAKQMGHVDYLKPFSCNYDIWDRNVILLQLAATWISFYNF